MKKHGQILKGEVNENSKTGFYGMDRGLCRIFIKGEMFGINDGQSTLHTPPDLV